MPLREPRANRGDDVSDEAVGVEIAKVGVVAIGRNEGERLRRCLQSLPGGVGAVVYVDSGSTDGSVAVARSMGVEAVELDMSIPFTAARARNAGARRLLELLPDLAYIQFLDGDCELAPEWLPAALESFGSDARLGVVCGRRREAHPEASRFNRLCDMEWNTPIGEADACGGDALIRAEAFARVGGYDDSLIAGEEPEMCFRMRRERWRILRVDREMTRHDARMFAFSQWWTRNVRAGHAYAEGLFLHRHEHEPLWRRDVRSAVLWAGALPLALLMAVAATGGAGLLLLLGYLWLYRRIVADRRMRGDDAASARLYARYCVLGKLPVLLGILRFHRNRLLGRKSRLIEYKGLVW